MPYESPEAIDFRGDFGRGDGAAPHAHAPARDGRAGRGRPGPAHAGANQGAAEKSVEVDMDPEDFDMSQFSAFLENLEKEAGAPLPDDSDAPEGPAAEYRTPNPACPSGTHLLRRVGFPRQRLQAALVRVVQQSVEEGEDKFFEKTLRAGRPGRADAEAVRADAAGDCSARSRSSSTAKRSTSTPAIEFMVEQARRPQRR